MLMWGVGMALFALGLVAGIVAARADASRSVPLTLERVRGILASRGIGVGTQFCVSGPGCPGDPDRYELTRINIRASGPDTFLIEVKIAPQPRHVAQ
jgi:hypothetical protein